MAPFIHLGVDLKRAGAARVLGDHDLGAAPVEIGDNVIAVEGFVANQGAKFDTLDQRRNPGCVKALARQQHKADEIAQGIGEGQDLGRHAALGPADGLARRPPFASCLRRWTLTMVATTMAYSMSRSSEAASKSRLKMSAFTQSRYRLKTVFQRPKNAGRSRQGLPVRAIHNTASTNRRLSAPPRPGSDFFPRQCGSILAHWASVSTNRSIAGLKHGILLGKS